MTNALERLLATLDVQLHAFAALEIAVGSRLRFDGMDLVVVHYVLEGRGFLEVEGAARLPIAAGSMLVIPPGRPQALVAGDNAERDVPAAENCSMLVDGLLKFDAAEGGAGDLRVICATVTASYGGSLGLFDSLAGPIVDDVSSVAAVRSAFDSLADECSSPHVGTHALTGALMKQCLILFVRRQLERGSASSPFFASLADTRLARAVARILERPGAPVNLAELASAAGMSRTPFAKAFTAAFGQTPMDFVHKTRLHRAAQLLAFTDLPVKVVAASTGFASRSHFSRAFRRAYGTDPSDYRDRHNRNNIALPANAGRG